MQADDPLHIPHDWTFKRADVAAHFNSHVREQLPWYDVISGAVAHMARAYIAHGSRVYDIGCSTGNIGRLLADVVDSRGIDFVGIDDSEQMIANYTGPGTAILAPATDFEYRPFSVAVLFLVASFLPVRERARLINKLASIADPGGAIIVVDKFEFVDQSLFLSGIMRRLTIAGKVAAGAPSEEIIAKELSLSGVQRPLTVGNLETPFCHGPFPWFRFADFGGYILEKH